MSVVYLRVRFLVRAQKRVWSIRDFVLHTTKSIRLCRVQQVRQLVKIEKLRIFAVRHEPFGFDHFKTDVVYEGRCLRFGCSYANLYTIKYGIILRKISSSRINHFFTILPKFYDSIVIGRHFLVHCNVYPFVFRKVFAIFSILVVLWFSEAMFQLDSKSVFGRKQRNSWSRPTLSFTCLEVSECCWPSLINVIPCRIPYVVSISHIEQSVFYQRF